MRRHAQHGQSAPIVIVQIPTAASWPLLQVPHHALDATVSHAAVGSVCFIKALRDAHRWLDELLHDPTQTTELLAVREGKSERSIRMTLSLAFISPVLAEAAMEGPSQRERGCEAPRRRGVEHRGPDVRDEARDPYNGERQMAERSPLRGSGLSRRRGGGRIRAQADLPARHPSAPRSDLSINRGTPSTLHSPDRRWNVRQQRALQEKPGLP
jgi:hypothetical protein